MQNDALWKASYNATDTISLEVLLLQQETINLIPAFQLQIYVKTR